MQQGGVLGVDRQRDLGGGSLVLSLVEVAIVVAAVVTLVFGGAHDLVLARDGGPGFGGGALLSDPFSLVPGLLEPLLPLRSMRRGAVLLNPGRAFGLADGVP